MDEYAAIRATIDRIRGSPYRDRVFGASLHRFQFNPVLTEADVAHFEDCFRVRLPTEYRRFLTEVGNGGAGPYYGLFPLGMMDEADGHVPWEKVGGLVGDPAVPFPHTDEWNGEFDPDEEGVTDEAVAAAEAANWSPALVSGAIPICHRGCALRDWLVVSGPLAGEVWHDARVDWGGLRPVTVDGRRDSFLSWYRRWLEEAAWVADGGTVNA
jgi:hypothetical protein